MIALAVSKLLLMLYFDMREVGDADLEAICQARVTAKQTQTGKTAQQ